MKWSSDKPTAPGYYWHRSRTMVNGKHFTWVVEIEKVSDVLYVAGLSPNRFILENASGDWAGPIPAPEEGG